MQIDLTQGPPNGFALFILAAQRITPLDLAFVGSPGCLLHVLPPLDLSLSTNAAGAAAVTFSVPGNPGLAGGSVHAQWVTVALPSLQIGVSNGGTANLAAVLPALSNPTVIAPPSGGLGTQIVVRVRNGGFGNNPDNCCLRLVDPVTNEMSLLRVTSIVFDAATSEDVVTARLATVANRGGPVQANIGMMRGGGFSPPVNASTCLNTPVSAWVWEGTSLPGSGLMVPTSFVPTPSVNQQVVQFVYESASNSMYVDVPVYPFGNGGLYPPTSGVTSDAHGDIQCGGGVPNGHFDQFVETATVKAGCNMTNQTVAIEHAPQLQQAFNNVFGAGRLTITSETAGALARIRIKPTNPACTLLGGGGALVVTQ